MRFNSSTVPALASISALLSRAHSRNSPQKMYRGQVTITIVVAMIEPPFLVAVYRIVGGIRIQNDLQWWLFVRLQKMIHKQTVDRRVVPANLLVRIGAE